MNTRAGLCPKLSCSRWKRSGPTVGLLAAALLAVLVPAAHAERLAPLVQASASDDALPGRYVVVLGGKPGTKQAKSAARAVARARQRGIRADHVYSHALNGFAAKLTAAELAELRKDPAVKLIAPDEKARAAYVHQSPAPWDLDRLDQINLPLNNDFRYTSNGAGVKVYVIDSGIRASHAQFGGRVTSGVDTIDNALPADDCNGHGTHVAGTIGGSTYGVAKGVSLVAVRVLDCSGHGAFSEIIAGVDWVTAQHLPGQPAVANMSISGAAYAPLDTAVSNSIADGVTYTVAAGDFGTDACSYSPARVTAAVTVGATTRTDARPSYSNIGSCLDLFAPGDDITSAWIGSDTATMAQSGTSMAAPHAAGVAAIYLQIDPTLSPAVAAQQLKSSATPSKVTNAGVGSPNLLLNILPEDAQITNVARRPNGKVDLFMRAADGNAAVATLDKSGRLIMAWTSLEQQVLGAPAAVWKPDGETLYVYAVAPNHHVIQRTYNSWSGWSNWAPALDDEHGVTTSNTVSVTRNTAGINVFMRGAGSVAKMMRIANSDGRLVHGWKNPGNGPDFLVLGSPTGSWTDEQRLNVYAVGLDHRIYTIREGGGTWGSWRLFAAGWHSETVGVADRGTSLDVLARTADDRAVRYCATIVSVNCGSEDLNKFVTSAPRGSWSPDKSTRDLVGRGEDESIDRRRWIEGTGWLWPTWMRSPVSSASVGAAGRISPPSSDVVHLLSVGNDQGAYVTGIGMNGTTPLPWTPLNLGRRLTDAPGGSWDPPGNLLDVVAVGDDHKLYRREVDRNGNGGTWSLLPDNPPSASASPSVTGCADGVTPVVRGRDGQVYVLTMTRSGSVTRQWRNIGGPVLGSPSGSWNASCSVLDVFGVGIDRRVYRRQYIVGSGWKPGWEVVPGTGRSDGGVWVARRPNGNMSVLIRSSTTREALLTELAPNGGVVSDWVNLGSKLLGTPSAYWSADGTKLDVYIVNDDYNVWQRRATSGVWSPSWLRLSAFGNAPLFAPPGLVSGPSPALTEIDDTEVPIDANRSSSAARQRYAVSIPAKVTPRRSDPVPPPSGTLPPLAAASATASAPAPTPAGSKPAACAGASCPATAAGKRTVCAQRLRCSRSQPVARRCTRGAWRTTSRRGAGKARPAARRQATASRRARAGRTARRTAPARAKACGARATSRRPRGGRATAKPARRPAAGTRRRSGR